MTNAELIAKADRMEPLTVSEIKRYRKLVKPNTELVCGKYGALRLNYLKARGVDWLIADLPSYLQSIDRAAERLRDVMEEKLSKNERYKRTGNFLEDVYRISEMQQIIHEEILNEIVYVDIEG